ncbi:MAG: calcium-binding protein [Deltaproteobacteria bacterium]|jgi:hypothetical protein|nr:calcium-binding protein [Deltaproteobacteria bacterium]
MGKKSNKKKKKKTKKKKVAVNVQKTTKNPVTEIDDTNDIDDVDENIARVMKILNIVNEEDMEVDNENLKKYFDYLNDHLDFSKLVTGMQDFRWEEYYVFGPGDQKEYEKLKKKNPSYTDKYQILSLEEYDYDESILVNVKRISDKKKFVLPLAELKAVDKDSNNFQLLEDFSMWFWNYR